MGNEESLYVDKRFNSTAWLAFFQVLPQGRGVLSIDGCPLLCFYYCMARKMLGRLVNRSFLWLYKRFEVDRIHDIALVDFGNDPHFKATMRASLQLIHDYDPIRFRRVQRHIGQIVKSFLLPGQVGAYSAPDRVCTIDFRKRDAVKNKESWYDPAFYASTLVHEATHGELHSRGIRYSPETRARVEKLCFMEQNRFARRVAREARQRSEATLAAVMESIVRKFDGAVYEATWNATKLEQLRGFWKRVGKGPKR